MDKRLKVVNHVLALLSEAFEVMEQVRNAPESPVTSYLPAKLRRLVRRNAGRLRRGKLHPRYLNLYSAEELAFILERAAERDEVIERGLDKVERILAEVKRVFAYDRAELEEGTRIAYDQAWQTAQEEGPGSKAAGFLSLFDTMIARGHEIRIRNRRKHKELVPPVHFALPGADPDRLERDFISAAEIVQAPRPDERVLRFPSETIASEKGSLMMRIGIGDRCWVGSFARGTTACNTVQLLPDRAHLLVVASGAGYVIEAVTRSLLEETGTDITEVTVDESGYVLSVDHADGAVQEYA
jgi:hypothetical protein